MMPSKILLVLASSFIAVTVSTNNVTTWNLLEPRAGQRLTNPDNEPPYQIATSGNWVDKSKVLSGVGPAAADSRFFDWDETCTDPDEREKIVLAWNAFQPLTASTSRRLADLTARLPHQPVGVVGQPNPQNEQYIAAEDPAYATMFNGRDTGLQWVRQSFERITANVQNFPGRGGGNRPAALRFICDATNAIKNGDGDSVCGTGVEEAEAFVVVPQGATDMAIEQSHRFSTATSITFCRKFFDDSILPSMSTVWDNSQIKPDLNNVDCRERVLIHEYMHIPWVRNMKPKQDVHGYFKAAEVALNLAWGSVKSTPECYAWYALYSAYNNERTGCGRDIWPVGVARPV